MTVCGGERGKKWALSSECESGRTSSERGREGGREAAARRVWEPKALIRPKLSVSVRKGQFPLPRSFVKALRRFACCFLSRRAQWTRRSVIHSQTGGGGPVAAGGSLKATFVRVTFPTHHGSGPTQLPYNRRRWANSPSDWPLKICSVADEMIKGQVLF